MSFCLCVFSNLQSFLLNGNGVFVYSFVIQGMPLIFFVSFIFIFYFSCESRNSKSKDLFDMLLFSRICRP